MPVRRRAFLRTDLTRRRTPIRDSRRRVGGSEVSVVAIADLDQEDDLDLLFSVFA